MANVLQSGVASAERVFELLDAPEQTPDSEPARTLPRRARAGGLRARVVPLRPGAAADRGPVAERRARAGRWPSSGRPVPARPRWSTWSCGSTTWTPGGSPSTASTSRSCAGPTCARRSAWCSRTRGCSAAPSATTSRTATPRPSEEQILEAARATYVDRFVRSLPDGYDTVIDDDGGNISAGERQLITIARAFLADPAILILDEATSSVDTRTEVLVQHAMAALRSDRTSFVIAHRLSTIRDADLILVMDSGQIVEQGTHAELLAAPAAPTRRCTARSSPPRPTRRRRAPVG